MRWIYSKMNVGHRYHALLAAFVTMAMLAILTTTKQCYAAGLLIADGGFGGRLEIVEHDVKVTINNGIAVTEVNQIFQNTENRQVEALYTFPVPKGASVSNFSMWINGKEMVGEVLEKKRARQIYDSYKRTRKDPGLLEQTDYKTFEMRIFPIGPKAKQRIQVTYYQELDFDHDWATYVYPLATTTKNGLDSRVNGKFAVSMDVKSTVPVVEMTSPSHSKDFLIINHTQNFYEASLENRDGDLARDVVLAFHTQRPITGLDMIASNGADEDGYFMMTLTAGKELEKLVTGSDYVFILDVSGSMSNAGKLNTSKNSIESFIAALGKEDNFEVITFNRQATALFNKLTPAAEQARTQAASFLNSLEARGGTRLQPALSAAYKYGNPDRTLNVVILSDGMTEQAEKNVLMNMISTKPDNARMFCIGVGNEINRPLLKQMAEDAGGLAAFISQEDDFKRQAQAFRRKLTHPIAANLQLRVNGMDIYDVEPQKLPNLYHGLPIRIYGRYRGNGAGEVILSGDVNGRAITTKSEIIFPKTDNDNPEIERMWAYNRMQTLEKNMSSKTDQTAINEIVRLGEAYSITSEYTSFIVLENDTEYKRWNIERRNALRIKRDRRAQEKVRAELERLRSKSAQNIGPEAKPEQLRTAMNQPQKQQTTGNNIPARQRTTTPRNTPTRRPRQSFDFPRFGGGGAFDPMSALFAAGLIGAGALTRRRKK